MDIIFLFEKYLNENYEDTGEKNTIKSYLSDIKQFINFFKEYYGEDITDFSRAHFNEYEKHFLEEKRYKFTTRNRKIASISIYENFLIEEGIRKEDKKVIRKKDFTSIIRPFATADQLPKKTIKKVLLKAGQSNLRDYAMFVILDEGGVRISELLNIQIDRDIDYETNYITIKGKGNKLRRIFMTRTMLDAIESYKNERSKLLNGRENKYLFISNKTANTNKPITRQSVNNILNKYCNEVNEKSINPHIMRHDCATKMYNEGCSELMLQKQLGQSSSATQIYIHTGEEKFKIQ